MFVVYDEMQYTKRDWRNRNLIKTPNGLKWLSIPVEVKGKYFQKINERKMKDLTYKIYDLLGMKGIARMDYIINDDGIPFLIETNSVPGMSKESNVPKILIKKDF